MDIQLFRTFLLVAKLLNITRAAEQLNFTQPAVTAQIRTLEGHFGVPLFERVGKKLSLTYAGRELLIQAEKLLEAYSNMHAALQTLSDSAEVIKFGSSTAMASYVLPPILRDFNARGIKGTVSIEICTFLADTVKGLLENTYDMALLHDHVDNSYLLQFPFSKERLVWVAQRELVRQNDNSLDITRYPFLNYLPGSVYRAKFEAILKEKNIVPFIEYSDAQSISRAVLDGLGVGVLPYVAVAPELADGKLIEFTTIPPLTVVLSVAFHKNKVLSPAMRALLSIFVTWSTIDNSLSDYLGS